MNNNIQKGGMTQEEICKMILNDYFTNNLNNNTHQKYLNDFCNHLLNKNVLSGQLTYNKRLFGKKLKKNDFFAGFNNAFIWLFYMLSDIENSPIKIDKIDEIDIKKTQFFNKPLILVDGLNIIRNNEILIGFFPLIQEKLPLFVSNVIILLSDNILYENRQLPKSDIDFYTNLKIVLDNVLPFILDNIKNGVLPSYYNMIVLQHDSGLSEPDFQAISTTYTKVYDTNKTINYIKQPKFTDNGLGKYVSLKENRDMYFLGHRDIYSSEKSMKGIETIYGMDIEPVFSQDTIVEKLPVAVYSKEQSMKGIITTDGAQLEPQFTRKFEGDDVTLVCIAFFLKMLDFKQLYIFSGDNYNWFLNRESIKKRLYITPTYSFANIVPFNIDYDNTLPFKIFPLTVDFINATYTNNIEQMMEYDENKMIIKTLYIDKLPTPMNGGSFKEKYLKYKNKYTLLKAKYN